MARLLAEIAIALRKSDEISRELQGVSPTLWGLGSTGGLVAWAQPETGSTDAQASVWLSNGLSESRDLPPSPNGEMK